MTKVVSPVAWLVLCILLVAGYLCSTELQRHLATGWTTASLSTNRDVPPDIAFHLIVSLGRTITVLLVGCIVAVGLALFTKIIRSTLLVELTILLEAIPP